MNLTLSGGQPRPQGVIRYPTPKQLNPSNCLPSRQSAPVQVTCGHFFFKNCVDQQQIVSSERNEVYQHPKLMQHSRSEAVLVPVTLGGRRIEEVPKRKISLSLCHSQNNFKTPKKMSVQISQNNNQPVNSKRAKTYSGHQQNLVRSNSNEQKPHIVNIHQMKSSLKPSTIPSSQTNSAKKSQLSGSRKLKLSLSGNFKSQIQPFQNEDRQGFQQFIKRVDFNTFEPQKTSGPQNSQEIVDSSFMTQKLANIYGEISQGPQSNIVYYNRIMGNQQWKIQPSQKLSETHKTNNNILPPSVSWNISQENQKNSQPSIVEPSEHSLEDSPPREPIRERRRIGDYAPTLKTFNNSQSKEDQESIVIGHGPRPNQFPPVTFQRGSVKDYDKEPWSQQFKRGCTSFGGEEPHSAQDRLQEWMSHPIEEDGSQLQN